MEWPGVKAASRQGQPLLFLRPAQNSTAPQPRQRLAADRALTGVITCPRNCVPQNGAEAHGERTFGDIERNGSAASGRLAQREAA